MVGAAAGAPVSETIKPTASTRASGPVMLNTSLKWVWRAYLVSWVRQFGNATRIIRAHPPGSRGKPLSRGSLIQSLRCGRPKCFAGRLRTQSSSVRLLAWVLYAAKPAWAWLFGMLSRTPGSGAKTERKSRICTPIRPTACLSPAIFAMRYPFPLVS
jgi:hypothetical protein